MREMQKKIAGWAPKSKEVHLRHLWTVLVRMRGERDHSAVAQWGHSTFLKGEGDAERTMQQASVNWHCSVLVLLRILRNFWEPCLPRKL